MCSIKKRGVYALLRCEALVWVAFLAVARGPTMSQADRLICPMRGIQCIDERIVVAKQRLPEASISVCCFIHKEGGIRDYRRERWRDPTVVGVVSPRRLRNNLRSSQSFLKTLRAHVERSGV